jgi:TRAP-type mannitol/chloroaromatic compound transport system substrate-binding protein
MNRRKFVKVMGLGSLLTTGFLTGCKGDVDPAAKGGQKAKTGAAAPAVHTHKTMTWKMVTTWPKDFPVLGTGAKKLGDMITQMSGGRLKVEVYGAGEIVPALSVFDSVRRGGAEMGHGAAYYWKSKSDAFQFFSAVPFGLTAQEMNGWLYHGGGMKLWEEAYSRFNLVPLAAGNTGVQMGGWFNKEINSLNDLKGLKMRIPGLGGEVLRRVGGTPVNIPGGELQTALSTGNIDATEWVGPYNDVAFSLHKAAKYYYYPGWHEPGTTLEGIVNKKKFDALPEDLQAIIKYAAQAVNMDMLSEYTARNNKSLQLLKTEFKDKVTIKRFPDDVLKKLKQVSHEVVAEIAKKDELSKRVYSSFKNYRDQVIAWHDISEKFYLNVRS